MRIVKNFEELLGNAHTAKIRMARGALMEMVDAAVESADPISAIQRCVMLEGDSLIIRKKAFDLKGGVIVVGGGKASGAMAEALEGILGESISAGVVNVPEGSSDRHRTHVVKLVEAGHPLPTEAGAKGADDMISLLAGLRPEDMVICLISGGGSALMSLPAGDITIEDLRLTNKLLLNCGANIQEINAVRKHISRIQGGQLARAAYPARVITLAISDVVGDRLDTIASGPAVPDPTTFSDAIAVLKKFGILGKVPKSVSEHLMRGQRGEIPETPKPREKCIRRAHAEVIASISDAVKGAARVGRARGMNVRVVTTEMQGEARGAGFALAVSAGDIVRKGRPVRRPALLLLGGETTVRVRGKGLGGRNQELALAAAIGIKGLDDAVVASFSTDGVDGPTDAAGAIADAFTIRRAKMLRMDPNSYLKRNDSYHFFEGLGDLLITGPTGTNVMDIAALVVP